MKKHLKFANLSLLALLLLPSMLFAQAEFDNSALDIIVNDYGRIRAYDTGGATKQVERISPLVLGRPNQVFDYQNDMENESPSTLVSASNFADFEVFGSYNNTYSNLPPNVRVDLNLYAWTGKSYFIVKYTITNNEATALTAIPGYEFICELDGLYGSDTTTYIPDQQAAIIKTPGATKQSGSKVLSHDLSSLAIESWVADYWVGDTNLSNWLTPGNIDQSGLADVDGALLIFGLPSVTIASGASFVFYLGAAVGTTQDDVLSLLAEAQTKYNSTFTSVENIEVPTSYQLSQNYPNPFNPTTKINFSIPESGLVNLRVYNTLGQVVANLINEEMSVGEYTVDFNGSDLSSGIYFVELSAGQFNDVKKITLMK
ncbi:MAG: T9SS type A sorting domain-containing protein [Bacteroidetes bacterium]|nr:T9SS type A sorting domain-containing protein [Bacteroidota bacterium]